MYSDLQLTNQLVESTENILMEANLRSTITKVGKFAKAVNDRRKQINEWRNRDNDEYGDPRDISEYTQNPNKPKRKPFQFSARYQNNKHDVSVNYRRK